MREHEDNFWSLLEPQHTAAGAFCRKLTGDRDEGDDLYQEAVVRALDRFSQLRDPDAFRPWFYRIIINCYHNRIAGPWWRRFVRLGREHDSIPSQEDPAGRVDARLRLEHALRPLSTKDRSLLLLYETEGWTVTELAGLSNLSTDAVKARLSRARRKAKHALLKLEGSVSGADNGLVAGNEV